MSAKHGLSGTFYWVGVFMTVACVGLVLAGNTKIGSRLEHLEYPLSWIAAGVGVLAFLLSEICRPAVPSDKGNKSDVASKYRGAFEI